MTRPHQKFIKPDDLIALQREIYQVFSPGTPVEQPGLFVGRRDELLRVDHYVKARGEVTFIYGSRSIGKTSLARHVADKYTRDRC